MHSYLLVHEILCRHQQMCNGIFHLPVLQQVNNCVFFLAFTFFLCSALKYHKMTKKLYPPQFMFNAGGTFIIIFVFFLLKCVLKGFCEQVCKVLEKYFDLFLIYGLRVKLMEPRPKCA